MSDVPRKTWRVPMGRNRGYSLAVLAYLWGYVVAARKRAGGPHFVFHTLNHIAEGLDVGQRQVSQGLTGLAEAGLVRGEWHEGQYGYWLFTPPGLEDPQQAPDRRADGPGEGERRGGDRRVSDVEVGARAGGDRRSQRGEIVDRQTGDRRSENGRSSIDLGGDRRSENGRSPIEFRSPKEEQLATQLATQLKPAELASDVSPLVQVARELLVEAAGVFAPRGPDGQLVVGPDNPQAVELLAQLLNVPDQDDRDQALLDRRSHVRHVLLAYAAICASDPDPTGQRQWWKPPMFSPVPVGPGKPGVVRKAPWLVVVGKVQEREALDALAQRRASEQAEQAEQARQAEAARLEAERRDAAARASWSPARIAEVLRANGSPLAAAVEHVAQPVRAAPTLTREELIERRLRISELIRVAQDNGEESKATELSQARLELSRALHALDNQPFGGS